jgi:catechol 2,3-dioxygenase-like lactoylglutathione lyase family enzyme
MNRTRPEHGSDQPSIISEERGAQLSSERSVVSTEPNGTSPNGYVQSGVQGDVRPEVAAHVDTLIPVLDVRDVDASIEFYCGALGFSVRDKVQWSGRTEWALLGAGKVQLMLCASEVDYTDEPPDHGDGVFFLYLDNIDALRVELSNRGYATTAAVPGASGGRDFYLRDPDGYILWFSHKPPVRGSQVSGT